MGFELVAVAEDAGGEFAAGRYYDAAGATFTTLIDARHTVSALYGMVNVPTGVWIDEAGRIVRPGEVAFSRDFSFLSEAIPGSAYVAALRDWVTNGADSRFALPQRAVAEALGDRPQAADFAIAHFGLALALHERGDEKLAGEHWRRAQELHPASWSIHRQAWVSLTEDERRALWMEKYEALDGAPYYAPLDLPDAPPAGD